ncbi:OmpA family protein [Hymenobacter endophyticus]|uniref:OmpA family protein n=1 Tax=Hymenobacter endophyticus TaxID=3076335 RepID=A0ABU3TFR7_9BACT|nr:OmpA family protein [Hymenobacter endophyticus]MDU0370209.1 OmpA family protein [Hymenobacter endophyticus]
MKRMYCYALLLALLGGPAQAQSLSGSWQGVETDTGDREGYWPTLLRVQQSQSGKVLGVLYQEVGGAPQVSVTFQVRATRTGGGLQLTHEGKLAETGRSLFSYWCDGAITFTYDPAQEKLTGRAAYRPVGDCDHGTFTLYRIKLKSAATVPANAETTIRVSGRNVLWYADAELKQPVATGNAYRTRLATTTTFYLVQGYYPTRESAALPITIRVDAATPVAQPLPVALLPPPPLARLRTDDLPSLPPTLRPQTAAPVIPTKAVVLPTVLFKLGTPELLADGLPALAQLAAQLKANPALTILVAGHTDKVGEPQKNQVLSEQRAEAVKTYLIKSGVASQRIQTVGYGDARPLYASPDARNRRVEVQALEE